MAGVVGLELEKGRIGLCQVRQTSQGLKLTRGASLPLPPGLLTPSLTEPNVSEEQEFTPQLRSLLKKAGWKGGRVVLALPDLTCRIGHQDFEELKSAPPEIRELLRWRLKDRLPFPAQEARINYQLLPSQENGTRLLYLLAREAVIAQYEALLLQVGLEPTRIITRGIALSRFLTAAGLRGRRLFLALGPSSLVLIYAEEGIPLLWRVLPVDDNGTSEEAHRRAEKVLRELHETVIYLEGEMGVNELDELLVMKGTDLVLIERLMEARQLPVRTLPLPQGVPSVDLLAPAGAALMRYG
jgi:hypothetical protein